MQPMNTLPLSPAAGQLPQTRMRALFVVLPALCAALYPAVLEAAVALIHASGLDGAAAAALGTAVALVAAWAVMGVSFLVGHRVGGGAWARILCHLAFTTPTLIVALGNFAGVVHRRGAVTAVWLLLWALLAAVALARPGRAALTAPTAAPGRRRLASAHAVSACAIIVLFIAPHLGNHLTGLWSGHAHIATMRAVRSIYRTDITQPLLLTLIVFQIVSGLTLVSSRLQQQDTLLGTLQTMTGIYVAVFFLGHLTAVFAARHAGIDTNWNWLTDNDRGLLSDLSSLRLVGHYWVGPIAIVTHLACGLRALLLQQHAPAARANGLAFGLMALAVVASSAILAGLLGLHIA
jgi:hypothetical protein